MTIIKYAQLDAGIDNVFSSEKALSNSNTATLLLNPEAAKVEAEIKSRFVKFAKQLKKVAPKAKDFIFFSTVMLHSGESSLVNQDTGEPLKDKNGKPLTAEWVIDKKTGSWKWKSSDPNIKPYKNCFVPGTKITMSDGTVKRIEEVNVGDEVITHKNRVRKVLRTFVNSYDGDILNISIRGKEKIICTPEHPFYNLDVTPQSGDRNDSQKHFLRQASSKKNFVFKEAKILEKSDILLAPVLNNLVESDLTPGKARLLGLFAAEGSYGKKYNKYQNVRFTFSREEYESLALTTKELLEKEFKNISVRIQTPVNRKICEVTVSGDNICEFFRKNVGEYSLHKTLSEELVFGLPEIKESFIIGWLDGDGCVEKTSGQIIGITVSENLTNQVGLMLNSLSIGNTLSKVIGEESRVINKNYKGYVASDYYRVTINATEGERLVEKAYRLKFKNRGKVKKQQLFHGDYALHTINGIFEQKYCGEVFNFEVEEDNSYVVNGIVVHNCNGDIFPEPELKKAYRKWIGRPLCKDHQSSSVDGIRGIIVDAYYDNKRKRVIGLCALDKVNYPDLARKVSTGYSRDVSMGTAVGKSICYNCGNVAKVESDYCHCVKNRTTYGEINIDLSPIELSLVVTGADPRAKLRDVIASLNRYSEDKGERIAELHKAGCVTPMELERIEREVLDLKNTVNSLLKTASIQSGEHEEIRNLVEALKGAPTEAVRNAIQARIDEITLDERSVDSEKDAVEVQAPKVTGGGSYPESQMTEMNFAEQPDSRFASNNGLNLHVYAINEKLDAMEEALRDLRTGVQKITKEESKMSDNLKNRAAARRAVVKEAYLQGGGGLNDPQTYPVDPMSDNLRTKGDKQMEGQGMEPGADGLHPGYESFGKSEEELKKMLSRAELEERRIRRQALLAKAEDSQVMKGQDNKSYVVQNGKAVELKAENHNEDGSLDPIDAAIEMYLKEHTMAYFQGGGGLNEPQTYSVDPSNDNLKTKGDKQMEGQGMEPGSDGMAGNDKAIKEKLLRADQKLRAKFVMAYKNDDKTVVDKANSRWEVYAGKEKVLSATGSEIFEEQLDANWEFMASKRYGREVLRTIRKDGLAKVAYLLKGAAGPEEMAPAPMPPMPPMPEAPKDDLTADADPKALLEDLTDCLTDAEKKLGDLKDAMEKDDGKTEATEIPSAVEAADDDEECEECKGECEEECEEKEEKEKEEKEEDADDVMYALDQSADELAMLTESIETRLAAGKSLRDPITAELCSLAKEAIAANRELNRQASLIVEAKKAKKEEKKDAKKDKKEEKKDAKKDKKDEKKLPFFMKKDKKEDKPKDKAAAMLDTLLKSRAANRREMVRNAGDMDVAPLGDDVAFIDKVKDAIEKLFGMSVDAIKKILEEEKSEPEHQTEEVAFGVEEEEASAWDASDGLTQLLDECSEEPEEVTASDRRAWRQKVAADVASKYSLSLAPAVTVESNLPIMDSTTLGNVDSQTSEAVVEGIVEMHDEIMRQVQKVPAVREAMDHLGSMLKSGRISLAQLDNVESLKALAIDPDAAKYFREYFGQGDKDCKGYGNELTEEYGKKKAQASLDENKAKIRRAYDLALEMQEKRMIGSNRADLDAQVDEIMKFDSKAFESVKKAVARMSNPVKVASAAPALNVGLNDYSETQAASETTIVDQLSQIWKK